MFYHIIVYHTISYHIIAYHSIVGPDWLASKPFVMLPEPLDHYK